MAEEKQEVIDWGLVGMTVAETAKCLRVHERTVRDMIATRPDFPARLMGGYGGRAWRISKAALERWLDGRDFKQDNDNQVEAKA